MFWSRGQSEVRRVTPQSELRLPVQIWRRLVTIFATTAAGVLVAAAMIGGWAVAAVIGFALGLPIDGIAAAILAAIFAAVWYFLPLRWRLMVYPLSWYVDNGTTFVYVWPLNWHILVPFLLRAGIVAVAGAMVYWFRLLRWRLEVELVDPNWPPTRSPALPEAGPAWPNAELFSEVPPQPQELVQDSPLVQVGRGEYVRSPLPEDKLRVIAKEIVAAVEQGRPFPFTENRFGRGKFLTTAEFRRVRERWLQDGILRRVNSRTYGVTEKGLKFFKEVSNED